MDRNTMQLLFGILLGIFFLALVVLTTVYLRRKSSRRRIADKLEQDRLQEETAGNTSGLNKGYWINKDDLEDSGPSHLLRCYHYFDNIDECIHDLVVEMYDCGFVRTEDIYVAAYGEDALTPDSFIYMTENDGDIEKARAALPPVDEDNQKEIYKLWCSYVDELLDTVEIHTTEANQKVIKDALMVYGRKKISVLLRSPE